MLFHSLQFLVFLPIVFALYWAVKTQTGLRKWVLLLASAIFYSAWDPRPYVLIVYCALVDFWLARAIGRTSNQRRRKLLVTLSVVNNLGVLGFFKYINLMIESVVAVVSKIDASLGAKLSGAVLGTASAMGIDTSGNRLHVVLPIGLSFVVFQLMSYTIDVYRKQLEPRRSPLDLVLYVSFFPHSIAGPIVRGADLLPQFDRVPTMTEEQGAAALFRIAKGLVKKLLIADLLAANLIDRVFTSPHLYSSLEVWAGVFAYTIQIYYDFSAYSDIAIGSAALFGLHFKENFNRPYKSRNLPEFWQRWHISLSTWLRDYLYIPLGGNRGGKLMTMRNVLITMILGGIWHGASWRYALWGLVHGIGLCTTRMVWWTFGSPEEKKVSFFRTASSWVGTFMAVMLARIYFRAHTMEQGYQVMARLIGGGFDAPNLTPTVLSVLFIGTAIHFGPDNLYDRASRVFVRLPIPVRAAALILIALVVKKVASFEVQPFIYFQF